MIKFTDEQLDIINSQLEGKYLGSASAGSGKSFTLVHRIKHMIEKGVNPSDICAISYTKESALDLKKKLEKYNITGVSCSTVHSLGFRICLKYDYKLKDSIIKNWEIDNMFYKLKKSYNNLNIKDTIRLINYNKNSLKLKYDEDLVFPENEEDEIDEELFRIC